MAASGLETALRRDRLIVVAALAIMTLLASLALLTVMMVTASGILAGVLLLAAGIYQWLPLKDHCLRECQAPLGFIARHGGFRSRPLGALRLGLVHGLYCVGCCWVLMLL